MSSCIFETFYQLPHFCFRHGQWNKAVVLPVSRRQLDDILPRNSVSIGHNNRVQSLQQRARKISDCDSPSSCGQDGHYRTVAPFQCLESPAIKSDRPQYQWCVQSTGLVGTPFRVARSSHRLERFHSVELRSLLPLLAKGLYRYVQPSKTVWMVLMYMKRNLFLSFRDLGYRHQPLRHTTFSVRQQPSFPQLESRTS
jgi:hypothetical protein